MIPADFWKCFCQMDPFFALDTAFPHCRKFERKRRQKEPCVLTYRTTQVRETVSHHRKHILLLLLRLPRIWRAVGISSRGRRRRSWRACSSTRRPGTASRRSPWRTTSRSASGRCRACRRLLHPSCFEARGREKEAGETSPCLCESRALPPRPPLDGAAPGILESTSGRS